MPGAHWYPGIHTQTRLWPVPAKFLHTNARQAKVFFRPRLGVAIHHLSLSTGSTVLLSRTSTQPRRRPPPLHDPAGMPAAVTSRARAVGKNPRSARDALPPAKKPKLSQTPPTTRQSGLKALLNGAPPAKPPVAAKSNGVRNPRRDRVDEATAVVGGGQAGHGDVDMEHADSQVIEISSGVEDSDDASSDGEDQDAVAAEAQEQDMTAAPVANGFKGDEENRPADDETAEPEELSFGERLQAQDPEPVHAPRVVDVEAAFVGSNAESRALATASSSRPLSAPSATSLGTVLTQALRTNDQDLLDSCLRVIDVDTIYATVERLPSPLVGTLLQKLAERLHKKPGRAGMLMVWVQWSLAAHGGYLASQPQLVKQLATLNKVLKERASGLQPLLSLKGRLDMLQAQLELRRRNQKKAANDDEDEAVIYVEGEEDQSSAEEDSMDAIPEQARKRIRQDSDEGESSADEMPTTMEVDENSDDANEDSEGMFDDEASETDNDTGDDLSDPMSDDGLDDGEGSESEEEAKPARRSTVGRAGLARRH
ncbi:NUC189-domain-containing protein [Melanomma pulvis-pyrius CBS 109.77]|uniref:NUC189-domain-containing protein n=1 Tax=Melanomma pulvis-pyrius CBS 109.77 TaxID=1314802 RepID=A0A6A6X112_9PLEO|nr:NUC189-domain-containing protein [Melanomma pulvis-pyrius CBS 109.77]